VAAPYLGAGLLGPALLALAGDPSELLGAVAGGERTVTVVLNPAMDRLATEHDDSVIVFDAAGADTALLVDLESSRVLGIEVPGNKSECSVDLTRSMLAVSDRTSVDVGPVAQGGLQRWEALALSALSADLVGVMRGSLGLAVEYAKQRRQYGQPIGSFQAVQHLCADQLVSLEAARTAVWYAAWCLDHRPVEEALRAARTAKAYCSEAGRTVAEACIQVHGGMGVTWECMAHVYLRRALVDAAAFGDSALQLVRLSPGGDAG
jgi:hypothetical protein